MSTMFDPVASLIDGLRHSRAHFFKHVEGISEEQLDWKPYPECKSVRETLQHLVVVDRSGLDSLRSGKEPDYESYQVPETDLAALRATLDETHRALLGELATQASGKPLDAEICVFGFKMPVINGIPAFATEDAYHTGQVAFVRMATDPTWDYYAMIYGG